MLKWKVQKLAALEKNVRGILETLGYNLKDPNFKGTPHRVAVQWFDELYLNKETPKKLFTVFPDDHKEMIILVNHTCWSRCPHHLERVKMEVSVGYIPKGRVLGLSKLARIADYFAQGLVLQETFAETLAQGLFDSLHPLGVGVYVRGNHQCMQARGIRTSGHVVTSALRGVFLDGPPQVRAEFLQAVTGGDYKQY